MIRNVRVAVVLWSLVALMPTVLAQSANVLTGAERAEGWRLLFDGESLTGWAPRSDAEWVVEDGMITAVPDSGRGLLATVAEYDNFQLHVEFWIDDMANSGVFIRCPAEGAITQANAFEINIYDPHTTWPTGSINEIARIPTTPRTVGQWNTFEIVANGDHLLVKLNGEITVDARSTRHTRGPIALQYNAAGRVRFRNVKIKSLE